MKLFNIYIIFTNVNHSYIYILHLLILSLYDNINLFLFNNYDLYNFYNFKIINKNIKKIIFL